MRGLFHNPLAFNSPPARFFLAKGFRSLICPPDFSFDTFVMAFAIGIAFYFGLSFEPEPLWVGLFTMIAMFFGWLFWRKTHALWIWGLMAMVLICGFARAAWHSHAVSSPQLPEYERAYDVSGWVERIHASGKGVSWYIVVDEMGRLAVNETPAKVRVRLGQKHKAAASVGDVVSLRAILSAPPGPVVPGGYSPRKRAYFEQVGGFGFAISVPSVSAPEKLSVKQSIARMRYALADRIIAIAPAETAGLQAALLTGVRRHIPPEHTDALRAAGLAHILAISGLHMGLLAGTAYYVFTLILSCIAPLARRFDIRKFAAILAIMAATAYLILSGASVATQRAYIMAVIIFTAVILDRRAISVRSVSVAAFITLVLRPESLTSVGFQMSFAAVLALVVVYRQWQTRLHFGSSYCWWGKVQNNAISLSVTSIVAGAATAGFALFHFGRIARYGLAGNLLAMPIFTFAVMPLGILALVCLPMGWEYWPLYLMGQALKPIIDLSLWIESWEGAMTRVIQAPNWVIGVYGLAFVWCLLGQKRAKVIGVFLVFLCIFAWMKMPVPDLRVSEEGRVAFWENESLERLIVTSERADRYGRDQFAEQAGRFDVDVIQMTATEAPCDALACRFSVKGYDIAVLNHPSEARLECSQSDIVILTQRDVGPEVRRHCQAILIDGRVLRVEGAQEIYLDETNIRKEGTKKPASMRRLWE